MAVMALVAGMGAGGAMATDPLAVVASALDALERGVMPSPNVVWAAGPDGPVERAATLDEVRDTLLRAEDALTSDVESHIGAALVTDVGLGAGAAIATGQCRGFQTRLLAFSDDFTDPMTVHLVGVGGPTVDPCGGSPGPYAEVLFDASRALASCATCAQSTAQAWLHAPPGATHVNDFVHAHHRGYGTAFESQLCWALCITYATFSGKAGTVELLAEPIDLPIPPTEFP